jgi:cation diffusion facilitator CzcD-associated flavoprotein CzcO
MYGKLMLSSPVKFLSLPGMELLATGQHISAREYSLYLEKYAKRNRIIVQQGEVTGIEPSAENVLVNFVNGRSSSFSAVIVATGMCDSPVSPTITGLTDLECFHAHDWQGPSQFAANRVVIVGGGMRAVELAEECAIAGLRPVVSVRGGRIHTWPAAILGWDIRHLSFRLLRYLPAYFYRRHCADGWRFRGVDRGFKKLVAQGRITVVPEIMEVKGKRVSFVDESCFDTEIIIFATGYKFGMAFIPKSLRRGRQGHPLVVQGKCAELPNVFFVGTPCAFQWDSVFIHGMANDARRVALAVEKIIRTRPPAHASRKRNE